MLFDSHSHMDDNRFKYDRDEILNEIRAGGVSGIVNVGADIHSSHTSTVLAKKYDFIYASVGVHPDETGDMTEASIDELRRLAGLPKVVAIGETGLDYHNMGASVETQKKWFVRQLRLAKELNLPVIIHNRDAHKECLDILKREEISRGVMHCFSGSAEMAAEVVKMGLYVSFAGVITYKNARVAAEALRAVPMERVLIETDSPYLSPEPFRGQRNHSGNVRLVAEKAALLRGLDFAEVARITADNARRLFGIK